MGGVGAALSKFLGSIDMNRHRTTLLTDGRRDGLKVHVKRRTPMSDQDNLRVARQGFDAWNAHDSNSFVKLIAEDYIAESDTQPAPLRGRDGARQSMEMYIKAFPDLHFHIEQMIASDECVVTRWHATGTHKGELMGIPPTGRRGEGIRGCTVSQYRNGKVVHEWLYWDVATLLRQIGVMPAPSRAV